MAGGVRAIQQLCLLDFFRGGDIVLDSASEHIFEFPEIVESLAEVPEGEVSVMVFGNSLMKHGVEMEQLRELLPEEGGLSVSKMTPVSTNVVDWTYLYKRYFENENTHPEVIFVGFVRHHIADAAQAYPIKNRRLGRHFLSQEDQWHVWKHELPNFHDKIQTSLAHYSSLIGDQPEHQYFLFRAIIPHYGNGLGLNNDWVKEWQDGLAKKREERFPEEPAPVTYERLERFLDMMNQHGVKVCMVPMPQPELYDLDQEIVDIVEAKGGVWLDARKLCLGEEFYSDGYHLGGEGIKMFTEWMAKQVQLQSR